MDRLAGFRHDQLSKENTEKEFIEFKKIRLDKNNTFVIRNMIITDWD